MCADARPNPEELDLADLKARAFAHIVASLSVHNIVDEVFGSFSATFAEVRKVTRIPSPVT